MFISDRQNWLINSEYEFVFVSDMDYYSLGFHPPQNTTTLPRGAELFVSTNTYHDVVKWARFQLEGFIILKMPKAQKQRRIEYN